MSARSDQEAAGPPAKSGSRGPAAGIRESSRRRPRRLLDSPFFWATLAGLVIIPLLRPLLRFEPAPPPVTGTLPRFELLDHRGRPFDNEQLATGVWILNLFFSRCRTACPTVMERMDALDRSLGELGLAEIRLLSLSVDPLEDTPERLSELHSELTDGSERWLLLTGEPQEVHRFVVEGLGWAQPLPAGEGPFDLAHRSRLVLLDPAGQIRGTYGIGPRGFDEVLHRAQHVQRQASRATGSRRAPEP